MHQCPQNAKKINKMSNKNLRRSKGKLSCLNNYIQQMNDFVSSSEEQNIQTDYQPEVNLQLSDDESDINYDILLKDEETIQSMAKSTNQLKSQNIQGEDNQFEIKQLEKHVKNDESFKYQEIKLKQANFSQEIEKNQQVSMRDAYQSSRQQTILKKDMNLSKLQPEGSSQGRKKSIFLSKDQKQKLQYDIKSERFLLIDLMRKYGISRSTIKRYLSEINTYGQILIPNQKTRMVSGSKQNKIQKFIKQRINKNPFLSQKQMALLIKQQMNLVVSQQTVSLILKKSNITKKKGMITYKEGNTQQNLLKRFEYAKIYETLNENKVIFMDQTGFNECIQVEYGYAPRGKRLLKQKSGKKGHKIVVILSMTYDRICHWDIVNLSVKTEHVASYIKKFTKQFRGYALIMDNARVHKTQQVDEAIKSVGLNPIFLPPYSPQLNPIQLLFGRLKTIYKSMSGIKLQQPEIQLSEKVNQCLKTLVESKLDNYKRPVNFWIKQAINKNKFNEVIQEKM